MLVELDGKTTEEFIGPAKPAKKSRGKKKPEPVVEVTNAELDDKLELVEQFVSGAEPEPEAEAEAEETAVEEKPESSALPSLVSQLSALNAETEVLPKTKTKNENVWGNVKLLFDRGLSNKEALKEIHEMYGNSNTTYACIAWYRNKYNKIAPSGPSMEEKINTFLCRFGASEEQVAQLIALLK